MVVYLCVYSYLCLVNKQLKAIQTEDSYFIPPLSRVSAHGRSQLKPEKSGVGPYTAVIN